LTVNTDFAVYPHDNRREGKSSERTSGLSELNAKQLSLNPKHVVESEHAAAEN